jgi:hypothetical protein
MKSARLRGLLTLETLRTYRPLRALLALVAALPIVVVGACGGSKPPPTVVASSPSALPQPAGSAECKPEENAYIPQPAWSGERPVLPQPPELPNRRETIDADYTVFGAQRLLQGRFGAEALRSEFTIRGVIVATNLASAPKCAFHRVNTRDPEGCVREIPTFEIADEATASPRIKVMGWASSFANVYEAQLVYKGLVAAPPKLYEDDVWSVAVPFPLPAVGAKVRVTGRYGPAFRRPPRIVTAPRDGIVTLTRVETLEPAKQPAALPR